MEIPSEAQGALFQLQQYQQQAQLIAIQRQQMDIQIAEIDSALEFLKKTKETEVYKAIGPVLAKEKKATVKKELEETKELIEVKMKTFERQDTRIRGKIKELSEKVSGFLSMKK